MGSFVPWLYYAFYCEVFTKIGYLILIAILGSSCIVVSLWDKFSEPRFRVLRAGKQKIEYDKTLNLNLFSFRIKECSLHWD